MNKMFKFLKSFRAFSAVLTVSVIGLSSAQAAQPALFTNANDSVCTSMNAYDSVPTAIKLAHCGQTIDMSPNTFSALLDVSLVTDDSSSYEAVHLYDSLAMSRTDDGFYNKIANLSKGSITSDTVERIVAAHPHAININSSNVKTF